MNKRLLLCLLFALTISSCGDSHKKRGRRVKETTRTEDVKSLGDNYSSIDKACNRLEVTVDTLSTENTTEIELVRQEINKLRVEAKDIASEYEASQISQDIKKQFIEAGIDYLLITKLNVRIEDLNKKFTMKFGNR